MISLIYKILTLRFTKEDILVFDKRHLMIGILGTWLVGTGRYWDNPKATILQHLGLGSIVYIFILAAFIHLLVLPLRLKSWSYFRLLTFISLTSFPAILYAIPVEKFMDLPNAQSVNVWFLTIVAAWRMILLFKFLKRIDNFNSIQTFVLLLLPICLIINALAFLNLEHVVFNIMGGNSQQSGNENAYFVVLLLTVASWLLVLPLLFLYGVEVYKRNKKHL